MRVGEALISVVLLSLLVAMPVKAVQWNVVGATTPPEVAARSLAGFSASLAGAGGDAITLAPSPAVADGRAVLRDLASGKATVGVFALAALEAEEPIFGIDRVPYLCVNFVDARKLWQVLAPRVSQSLAARGLTLLYAVAAPPSAPLANRALSALADWRGSRLLSPRPLLDDLSRILGAQAIRGASPREAMAAGKVDMAFVAADAAAGDRAWEYASHYLHAPAWFPKHLVVARTDAVSALPDGARAALVTAAREAQEQGWTLAHEATEDGVQKLRDYGVKTSEPPVGVLIQLESLGRELLFIWSDAAGETGALMVEEYYAIR